MWNMNLLEDESGQSLVLVAAFAGIVMLGFLAFTFDVGFSFRERRMAQAAADAAAVAAAEEQSYPGDSGNAQAAANAAAKLNGFDTTLAANPATVTLTTVSSGNYSNSGTATSPGTWVQAVVSRPVPTIFLGAFNRGMKTLTISAVAVSGGAQSSPTCVCLEGTTGEDLNMSNAATLTASSCGVTVNSSSSNAVGVVGSAVLSAQSLGMVSSSWTSGSNVNNGGSITPSTKVVQGISTSCTPPMPAAPTYSTCLSDPGGSSTSFTAGPAVAGGIVCYTSLTVGANGTLDTLNPGIYVITGTTGNLHFESGSGGISNKGGNGVFFYLTGSGTLQIDNGANVNLVAGGNTTSGGLAVASTGTYNGILVEQASSDTTGITVAGGSSMYMNGAIYAPSAVITLDNGSNSTVTANIVAKSLTLAGGGQLAAASGSNLGTLNIAVAKVTQ
jgi:hypothetical protein